MVTLLLERGKLKRPFAISRPKDAGDLVNFSGAHVTGVTWCFCTPKILLDDVVFPKIPQQGFGEELMKTARAVRCQFLELFRNEVRDLGRIRALYTASRITD